MHNKILFTLLLACLSFTSCSGDDYGKHHYIEKNNIILALTNTFNVKAIGEQKETYPEGYTHYNKTTNINVDRDYALLDKNTPATRENVNGVLTTYFRDKNGYAVSEYYNEKNEVELINYQLLNRNIVYNDVFVNPFTYIDATDISEDYKLNPVKASLVANKIAGMDVSVKTATFVLENDKPTSLEFDIYPREDSILTYELEEILVKNEYKLKLNFSYDVVGIAHLSPRSLADDNIKNALTKDNKNFTFTFTSNATSDTLISYVVDDNIFVHNGINQVGCVDGDLYYDKIGDNNYDEYVYRSAIGGFVIQNYEMKKEDILPSLNAISPNLYTKQSDNVYELDSLASLNTLHLLLTPQYPMAKGMGKQGVLTLKDGNVSSINMTFGTHTIYTINENYYDYGDTSMPTWLDISSIM